MTEHKQVSVRVGDMEAEVDEALAPLITEAWRAGISTVLSCQENRPGIAWIMFLTPDDASRFMTLVAEYEEGTDTLYNRMSLRWDGELSVPAWEYDLHPLDWALDEDIDELKGEVTERYDGVPDFTFNVSIRFPTSDIAVILDRLARHNWMMAKVGATLARDEGVPHPGGSCEDDHGPGVIMPAESLLRKL